MNLLLAAPLLIPMLAAIACLAFWKSRTFQRITALAAAAGILAAGAGLLADTMQSGIRVMKVGDWPAPAGIVLVADVLSALMIVVTGLVGLTGLAFSAADEEARREAPAKYPLLLILLMGVSGTFLTGDLFNLYVWIEVMLMASFVLLGLGGGRYQIEGSLKYVTLNLVASSLLLIAIGVLYGTAGSLNLADLAMVIRNTDRPELATPIAMVFLVAFGIKAAIFPFFYWLPSSYHTPPAAISAIFAGLLTKVGVYALLRMFTLLFVRDTALTHSLILWLAALTMTTGVLGAMAQTDFRRLLSFHIISQIGYMIMGLGLFTRAAVAGSIFFVIHNIIAKTNLFFISGAVRSASGSYDLDKIGGIYSRHPVLSLLFLIPAFSLAGTPPLSGFIAKLALVKAGIEVGRWSIVAVALGVGLLTLYSMTKIWTQAFWTPSPAPTGRIPRGLYIPIVVLASLTVFLGLVPGPLAALAERAADQLMDPEAYIRAVLAIEP